MKADYREEPCRSALNRVKGMGFSWSLNPYMGCAHRCTFCYVRAFERRADRPSDDRYGTSLRVKTNIVEVLRAELRRASWRRELVAIGAATDPYQPAEATYRLTRGCLAALAHARNPFGIVTRAPLVVRDLDLLQEASRRAEISVSVSIPTLDEEVWRKTEPGTPHPRQRLRAVRALVDGGIHAGIGMAPLLPGLSTDPKKIGDVVRGARDAGATFLWANTLYLKPGTREHFLEHLKNDWPERLPFYEQMYHGRAYLPREKTQAIKDVVSGFRRRYDIADRRPHAIRPETAPEPEQISLAI
jgi:DNA repair photolyase